MCAGCRRRSIPPSLPTRNLRHRSTVPLRRLADASPEASADCPIPIAGRCITRSCSRPSHSDSWPTHHPRLRSTVLFRRLADVSLEASVDRPIPTVGRRITRGCGRPSCSDGWPTYHSRHRSTVPFRRLADASPEAFVHHRPTVDSCRLTGGGPWTESRFMPTVGRRIALPLESANGLAHCAAEQPEVVEHLQGCRYLRLVLTGKKAGRFFV